MTPSKDQAAKQKQLVIPYSISKAKKITFKTLPRHPVREGREWEPPPGTPNATTLEPKHLRMDTVISLDDRKELDPGKQQMMTIPQGIDEQKELIENQTEPDSQKSDQEDILMVDNLGDEGFT